MIFTVRKSVKLGYKAFIGSLCFRQSLNAIPRFSPKKKMFSSARYCFMYIGTIKFKKKINIDWQVIVTKNFRSKWYQSEPSTEKRGKLSKSNSLLDIWWHCHVHNCLQFYFHVEIFFFLSWCTTVLEKQQVKDQQSCIIVFVDCLTIPSSN